MGDRITDNFCSIFCEKNSDGTKNLRFKGNELNYRIGKRVRDCDVHKIASFLIKNPVVVKLELAYNEIGDDGLQTLISELLKWEWNNIQHLSLVGCNITHRGVTKLGAKWQTLKFKTLRLTGNRLGAQAGPAWENLLKIPTLQHFDIGDTNQTLASIPYVMASLRSDIGRNQTVRVLDISNVIPSSDHYQFPSSHMAEQLSEMIKMNFTLIELHVQKCQFDGHDVELLLKGLKLNTTLLMLDLGFNRINNFGAELIAEWLKTKPSILGLNISGNMIGDHGASALSFGLPFSKLRLLDISMNKINNEALVELLKTVKKKCRLRLFYLWGNLPGQEAMKIMRRQMKAGVYEQQNTDFKVYEVDGVLQVAKYFPDRNYKNVYYCQLQQNEVRELRIKRNKVSSDYCNKRVKVNFVFIDRIEGVKECETDAGLTPKVDDAEELRKCEERERLKKELEYLKRMQLEKINEEEVPYDEGSFLSLGGESSSTTFYCPI